MGKIYAEAQYRGSKSKYIILLFTNYYSLQKLLFGQHYVYRKSEKGIKKLNKQHFIFVYSHSHHQLMYCK